MSVEHQQLRRARRHLVSVLWPRRARDHRFLWRRAHLLLTAGTTNVPPEASGLQSRLGVRERPFFVELAAATASRAGELVHVTLYVYAVSTYLPAVPRSMQATFDFEVGAPGFIIDADEATRLVLEERAWLLANPAGSASERARALVPSGVRRVDVDDSGEWWRVADVAGKQLLVDGNRRFALADDELSLRSIYVDLREALDMADWA